MNNYDYCMVSNYIASFDVRCTDPKLSLEIYDEIKKYYPNAKLQLKMTLPTGDDYGFRMTDFKVHTENPTWFTIKLLCSKSWEPLGVSGDYHTFRRLSTS